MRALHRAGQDSSTLWPTPAGVRSCEPALDVSPPIAQNSDMADPYRLFSWELSYFSGKVRAYIKAAPFRGDLFDFGDGLMMTFPGAGDDQTTPYEPSFSFSDCHLVLGKIAEE